MHTINSSNTIFIFILDYLIYGITINLLQGIGIAIGFFGVLIVSNSGLIISSIDKTYEFKSTFQNYITEDPL